jgi:hypothetical protein
MAPRIGYRDAWYRRLFLVGGRAIGANPDSEIEHVAPPVPPGLEPGQTELPLRRRARVRLAGRGMVDPDSRSAFDLERNPGRDRVATPPRPNRAPESCARAMKTQPQSRHI